MLFLNRALSLLERSQRGEMILGLHASTVSEQVIELAGMSKLDYVILGMEVEPLGLTQLERLIRAADAAGLVSMVKIRYNDPQLASDAFTQGAHFVMVPHTTNGDQLRALIQASRFPPEGTRAHCPVARYVGYGTMPLSKAVEATKAYRMIIPIIEDKEALDNIDDILSVEDGGIIEIGPYDLSISLGCKEPDRSYANKETMEAIEMVAAKARERKKVLLGPVWHQPKMSIEEEGEFQRKQLVARGMTLLYESDLMILMKSFARMNRLRAPS